jgi:hypothetical protein
LLPRLEGDRPGSLFARARGGLLSQAQYVLVLVLLFGAGTIAVRAGLVGYRPAATADPNAAQRNLFVRLNARAQRNYTYRLRQLERDLRRDETDWDVLRRLGQLHLCLAVSQAGQRSPHLRLARFYLRRAHDVASNNRENQIVRALLDAANNPSPTLEMLGVQGDFGPPPRIEERYVRMRLGWLEEQAALYPRRSRLLCRLGETYVSLLAVMEPGRPPRIGPWPGASGVSDPGEVRHLAEQAFRRALACSTTHEARSRVHYGEAQLYRTVDDPERAMAALRRLLRLQPNNWFAALEMATLCRLSNRKGDANRYEALSARWRTPGWI